jgi:hypothetical protein
MSYSTWSIRRAGSPLDVDGPDQSSSICCSLSHLDRTEAQTSIERDRDSQDTNPCASRTTVFSWSVRGYRKASNALRGTRVLFPRSNYRTRFSQPGARCHPDQGVNCRAELDGWHGSKTKERGPLLTEGVHKNRTIQIAIPTLTRGLRCEEARMAARSVDSPPISGNGMFRT